jgi:regulator of protease activity HflC (stomatin/prohibitin superfamily)
MITERVRTGVPGAVALIAILLLGIIDAGWIAGTVNGPLVLVGVLAGIILLVCLGGFFVVSPNEAKVLLLFGRYVGTVKQSGLHWANPFLQKKRITLRAISFESNRLKVNDIDGNPIEIAAIVVYRIVETAQAAFQVDDASRYVTMQAEAALRGLAQSYPYDAHDHQESLRGSTGKIAEHLKQEIQERVKLAGVEVIEARISHLAYSPEIAQAMLQRQQAGAIIAARQKIVDGAVGMVEMALERLSRNHVVQLDEERKAQMVSNLLVVLCGERATQPVVNAGTIYQ